MLPLWRVDVFALLTFLWLWFLFYPFCISNNHVVQRLLVCASFCSKLNGGQVRVCIVFLRKIKQAAFIDLLGIEMSTASPYPTLPSFFFFKVWSCVFQSIVLYDQVLTYHCEVLVASETGKVLVVCLHISCFPSYSSLVAWVVDAGGRLTLDGQLLWAHSSVGSSFVEWQQVCWGRGAAPWERAH